ncbi:acyl-CoA N-acyltransferase [Atractiella rhizophila]|nr:acyl-CoA N-acyltransferase [Atractiella rhizophila]
MTAPKYPKVELRTQRLLLRETLATDAPGLHEVYSDAEVMRYGSRPPHASVEETTEVLAGRIVEETNGTTNFSMLLLPSYRPIGNIGLYKAGESEIGFMLLRSEWRKGLVSEALKRLLPYYFDELGMEDITADCDPRNLASVGLLKKWGFEETGTEEKTFFVGGEWCDSVYLRLKKENYLHSITAKQS